MSNLYRVVATFTEVYVQEVQAASADMAEDIARHDIDWGAIGSPEYETVEYEVEEYTDD